MKHKIYILFIAGFCTPASLFGQDLSQKNVWENASLTGGASARFIGYSANGIEDRRKPFTYVFGANASVNALDWSVPFSFTYSNQQYVFSQPFNQFGMSPTYKWATLHLGYRNLNFSQYTLAGHQILGAGFEVKPGKFRVSFMKGRFRRTVEQDTTLLSLRQPVYKRTGWAARVGYATSKSNIDLIIVKAKDDENSVNFPQANSTSVADNQVLPAENVVVGINARHSFQSLIFNLDASTSVFVQDNRLEDESGDLPTSARLVSGLIDLNSSTRVNHAIKTGLGYNHKLFSIKGYFLKIDPDYQSMGTYFINNDIMAYNVSATTQLWKGRIQMNGALTRQTDNLNNQKSATTRRILPAAGLQVIPVPAVGFGFQYTNYTSLQLDGSLPLDNALKSDQQNPIITFNGYYQKTDTITSHLISAFLSRAELIDNNQITRDYTQYVGNTFNLTYSFTYLPSDIGASVSYNRNQLDSFNGNLPGNGFSVGANKAWEISGFDANIQYSWSKQADEVSTSINGGVGWTRGIHNVSLNINHLNSTIQSTKINELTIYTQYAVRFNTSKKSNDAK